MNEWLAPPPQAQVTHGMTGCMVSLEDMADRAPRVLADGEVIDLGGKHAVAVPPFDPATGGRSC